SKPFPGRAYAVNPKAKEVLGIESYPSVTLIPGKVDLAVICTPSKTVVQIMQECAQKKVKAVIITSAGFAELGENGKNLQEQVLSIAKVAGITVLGPNCLGIIRPPVCLNASFALTAPQPGQVAFVSQSGALADSIIDWAVENRYCFSLVASLGNSADVDASDFLKWCSQDESTKAIALYLEGIKDGRRFMEIARKVSRTKPIVLLKGGRSKEGVKAAGSHTGSLVGNFNVWQAAAKQSGIVMAETLQELFEMAEALAEQPRTSKNAVAIVTNGGGAGVLTADYCQKTGLNVVELKEETLKRLDESNAMHPAYSRGNPLDLIGDARPERYKVALDVVLSEDYIGSVIVIQTLQTMTDTKADAQIVIDAKKRHPHKPVVCVFMGGKFSKAGIELLRENNVSDFNDPRPAVRVMAALCGTL
ncbi:MAG: acetate--CoA ligase family protein, partial [Candidatus Micrarchaeia archaeon]